MHLQLEVEAGGSGVTICQTLQGHVASFYERFLCDDLKADVLCGVCGEEKESNRRVYSMWGRRVYQAECVPLTAAPRGPRRPTSVCRENKLCASVLVMTNFTMQSRRRANCSHISRHSTRQSFRRSMRLPRWKRSSSHSSCEIVAALESFDLKGHAKQANSIFNAGSILNQPLSYRIHISFFNCHH